MRIEASPSRSPARAAIETTAFRRVDPAATANFREMMRPALAATFPPGRRDDDPSSLPAIG